MSYFKRFGTLDLLAYSDPYRSTRLMNIIIATLFLFILLFFDLSDKVFIVYGIVFWILWLENSVLYVASEIRALRLEQAQRSVL